MHSPAGELRNVQESEELLSDADSPPLQVDFDANDAGKDLADGNVPNIQILDASLRQQPADHRVPAYTGNAKRLRNYARSLRESNRNDR